MEAKSDEQKKKKQRKGRLLVNPGFNFLPETWEQLFAYAKEIATTEFVPVPMRNKPAAVLAAWQKGHEVGLKPMASLQNICIINGRPSIHSAGYWSLILNHPLCEDFCELPPHEALEKGFGECTIRRRGKKEPVVRRFTMEDAKRAGLVTKDNWRLYPGTMLMHRARHLAGDAALPEATQGLVPTDVARDLGAIDITPQAEETETPAEMPVDDLAQQTADYDEEREFPFE